MPLVSLDLRSWSGSDLRPLAGLVATDAPKRKTELVPLLAKAMTNSVRVRHLYGQRVRASTPRGLCWRKIAVGRWRRVSSRNVNCIAHHSSGRPARWSRREDANPSVAEVTFSNYHDVLFNNGGTILPLVNSLASTSVL